MPSSSSSVTNPRLRTLLSFFRKWTTKDYTIAAFAFIILFSFALISQLQPRSDTHLVPLTLLRNANQRGALCLDGSSPGYHFQKGFGSGSRNWLLHVEGGGWCNSISSCSQRKMSALGSSKYMQTPVPFSGILSSDPSQNPDFFNWNKVKIRYCDGASFAGHPESEVSLKGSGLFFRGQIIWETIMDELLSIGMSKAKQALLSGCSAGGLATLVHCDDFRQVLPKEATVKCLADAGFFLDEKDILGNSTMRSFYHDVVQLQGVAKSLQKECIAKMEPYKCFFPSEIIKNIKTPVFLVHPAYDFWQIHNILVPEGSDPRGHWKSCRLNIHNCDANLIDILHRFRSSLLKAVNEFEQRKEIGMFINSCFIHCQTWMGETWHSPNSPKINDKTIAESVADWFFDREVVKRIDCPYPCNPTCHNMDFS
ncbi:pectin acetylesterase 5-like isoform X2 [Gastrolobium bilobum]|uniref:pectin acetylesterase 5-like isoform X2 n=1 Tax=Gastrolobium bilobum TaxID=150636 RepID=UPI002AB0849A|nr:pectin acetylesterase 5-like isoform X2 [Gastrolobium bilobum]